jgi:hypothetical protein
MKLYSICFSDGSHGALLSQEQAIAAYDRIDSDRRPLCSVTTWTLGTRDAIVAEWLRERIRGASWCHEQWKHDAGMSEIIYGRIAVLHSELDMLGVALEVEEQDIAETLRPSAPVDKPTPPMCTCRAQDATAASHDADCELLEAHNLPRSELPTLTDEVPRAR